MWPYNSAIIWTFFRVIHLFTHVFTSSCTTLTAWIQTCGNGKKSYTLVTLGALYSFMKLTLEPVSLNTIVASTSRSSRPLCCRLDSSRDMEKGIVSFKCGRVCENCGDRSCFWLVSIFYLWQYFGRWWSVVFTVHFIPLHRALGIRDNSVRCERGTE